jgi:excisionase family DNA binding protein
MLGVDRRTVYKWIDAGLLPARKLPSMGATRNTEWRIRADDVDWFSDGVHMESGFLEPK